MDRLAGLVGVEDVAEDQPGPLNAPDHVEIGVHIRGTPSRTGMAHPGPDHDVRVVADEPGVVPVLRGARLCGEGPLDVEGRPNRPQDVTDHVGDRRGQDPHTWIRLPLLQDTTLAVDHLEEHGRIVVNAA